MFYENWFCCCSLDFLKCIYMLSVGIGHIHVACIGKVETELLNYYGLYDLVNVLLHEFLPPLRDAGNCSLFGFMKEYKRVY